MRGEVVNGSTPWVKFATLGLFLLLSGCLTAPSSGERLSTADTIAQEAEFHRSKVRTRPFLITAYSRIQEPGKELHIYIEGDGYAWVTRNRVSGDPTPRRPVALELAAEDPAPNVVYLARPCQYTPMEMDPACEEAYWTDKRFSEEVIGSMDQAVDYFALGPLTPAGSTELTAEVLSPGERKGEGELPARGETAKSPGIHLIGYSGGGTVAAILAARRQDVKSLRTVAGNLDPNGLNEHHEVSPLAEGSVDPMEVAAKLSAMPQYHFTGSEDSVVPAFIADNFSEKEGNSPCVHVRRVEGADHVNGWTGVWPRLLALPMDCPE